MFPKGRLCRITCFLIRMAPVPGPGPSQRERGTPRLGRAAMRRRGPWKWPSPSCGSARPASGLWSRRRAGAWARLYLGRSLKFVDHGLSLLIWGVPGFSGDLSLLEGNTPIFMNRGSLTRVNITSAFVGVKGNQKERHTFFVFCWGWGPLKRHFQLLRNMFEVFAVGFDKIISLQEMYVCVFFSRGSKWKIRVVAKCVRLTP